MGSLILQKTHLQNLKGSDTFISSLNAVKKCNQVNLYTKLQMVLPLLLKHPVIFKQATNEDVRKNDKGRANEDDLKISCA
jgi:hypothetical protein